MILAASLSLSSRLSTGWGDWVDRELTEKDRARVRNYKKKYIVSKAALDFKFSKQKCKENISCFQRWFTFSLNSVIALSTSSAEDRGREVLRSRIKDSLLCKSNTSDKLNTPTLNPLP